LTKIFNLYQLDVEEFNWLGEPYVNDVCFCFVCQLIVSSFDLLIHSVS